MAESDLMNTSAVADALGIQVSTVYAYVSRGILHPVRTSRARGSRFRPEEVFTLKERGRGAALDGAISEISSVIAGSLHYRGESALSLARTKTFEPVALFVITGIQSDPSGVWRTASYITDTVDRLMEAVPDGIAPADRIKIAIAAAGVVDPLCMDLRRRAVVATMQTLVATMVRAISTPSRSESIAQTSIAAQLTCALSDSADVEFLTPVVETALILLIDHALAPSTVAARIAAASHANPYSVVLTGLNVGSGSLHGDSPFAIERYLRALDSARTPVAVLNELSGSVTPGFGHPLYTKRDPRADAILDRLRSGGGVRMEKVDELLSQVERRDYPAPNAHLALAALAFVGELRPGAAEALFITARSVGWIAHALEEYSLPSGSVRRRISYLSATNPSQRSGR